MKGNNKNNIRKLAEKSLNTLLNDDFKQRFESNYYPSVSNQTNHSKSRWLKFTSALIVFLIIAIVVPCAILIPNFLSPLEPEPDIPTSEPPHYAYGNEITQNAKIDDLNYILSDYNLISDNIIDVSIVVDSVSGDELYYVVSWMNQTGAECLIYFVINKYYDSSMLDRYTENECEINGLKISMIKTTEEYYEQGVCVYFHKVYAKTTIGEIKVYFNEYNELSFNANTGFKEFVFKTFDSH